MKNLIKTLLGKAMAVGACIGLAYGGDIDYSRIGGKPVGVTYHDSPKARALIINREKDGIAVVDDDDDREYDTKQKLKNTGSEDMTVTDVEMTDKERRDYELFTTQLSKMRADAIRLFGDALVADVRPISGRLLTELEKQENGVYVARGYDETLTGDARLPITVAYDPRAKALTVLCDRDGVVYQLILNGDSKLNVDASKIVPMVSGSVLDTVQTAVDRHSAEKARQKAAEKKTDVQFKELLKKLEEEKGSNAK